MLIIVFTTLDIIHVPHESFRFESSILLKKYSNKESPI